MKLLQARAERLVYLINHLRHGLTAGLALLALPAGPHLEVVLIAVAAIATVETVGQRLP